MNILPVVGPINFLILMALIKAVLLAPLRQRKCFIVRKCQNICWQVTQHEIEVTWLTSGFSSCLSYSFAMVKHAVN